MDGGYVCKPEQKWFFPLSSAFFGKKYNSLSRFLWSFLAEEHPGSWMLFPNNNQSDKSFVLSVLSAFHAAGAGEVLPWREEGVDFCRFLFSFVFIKPVSILFNDVFLFLLSIILDSFLLVFACRLAAQMGTGITWK